MNNLSTEEKCDVIHHEMLKIIERAWDKKIQVTCQEIIDSSAALSKKLEINKYGNFGPIKKVLWKKATDKQKRAMKGCVTDKSGSLIYREAKWKF